MFLALEFEAAVEDVEVEEGALVGLVVVPTDPLSGATLARNSRIKPGTKLCIYFIVLFCIFCIFFVFFFTFSKNLQRKVLHKCVGEICSLQNICDIL